MEGIIDAFKKKKFWFNLHLILSFICAIPLIIIAITGSVISYHDEIIDLLNESEEKVEKGSNNALSITEILEKFRDEKPGFNISFVSINNDENTAIKLSGINFDNKFDGYFVDPYTAKIVGENIGDKFIGVMLSLHEDLGFSMLGNKDIGKHIVAISTIMLIVLLVSGVIIYYPYYKNNFSKAFKINYKAKGYTLLYQVHAALGMWSGIVLFIICTTGLYFSYDFVAKITNKMLGEEQVQRCGSFMENRGFLLSNDEKIAELGVVFDIFNKTIGDEYETINIMIAPNSSVYSAIYMDKGTDDESKINMISMDAKEGKILRHIRHDDEVNAFPKPFRITKTILNLHSGYTFGEIGKFIFCLASFLVSVFVITRFWMMMKRVNRTS